MRNSLRTLRCAVQLCCCSTLLLCWTAFSANLQDYNLYDRVRNQALYNNNTRDDVVDTGDDSLIVIQSVEFSLDPESTSQVAKVQLVKQKHSSHNQTPAETQETIRLVDVASFLPFDKGESYITTSEAAVLLLGIYHFNHKEQSPVLANASPALRQCNVRLTTELFDTESDEVTGTALLNSLLEDRPVHNLTLPRPSAVVGSYFSRISSPQTILGSIKDVLQISPASTSANLDDQEVYPLFGRTCPSSDGEASAILDYYMKLGVSRVGILFFSDAFGSALQRNFEEQARSLGMETRYAGFVDLQGIPVAIRKMKDSQFQHIFVAALEIEHFETIMVEAHTSGIANGKHAWLFYGLSQWSVQDKAAYAKDSILYKASQGVAIANFGAAPQTQIQYPGQRQHDPLPAELKTANEKFRSMWRDVHKDEAFLKYLSQKLPSGVTNVESELDVFHDVVSVWSFYLYDAITSIGIAMCKTGNEFFSGKDLITIFSTIAFEGISGQVEFNDLNTRKHETIQFTVWNMLLVNKEHADDDGLHRFIMSPTSVYSNGQWDDLREFVYADGTVYPPEDLVAVQSSTDAINEPIRWIGISLSIAIMASALFCIAWALFLRRNEPVVRSSQPLFLVLVAFGSLLQASALIPLSLDHSDDAGSRDARFQSACMVVPWLYYAGLSIMCAAFYSKTHRLFEILKIPEIEHLVVERQDFAFWICLVLGINSSLLVMWTLLDPLKYEIVVDGATDIFGRPLLSHGICRSENNDPNGFWLSLLLVNVCALLAANFIGYKTRLIKTQYKESQYIAFALGTISEALVIGGAMQHATKDEPDANYVVQVGSVFLTSFVTGSLVFAPKIFALRGALQKNAKPAINTTRTHERPTEHPQYDSDDEHSTTEDPLDERSDRRRDERPSVATSGSDSNDYGIAVLYHPRSSEAAHPFASGRFGSRALINVDFNSGGSNRVRYDAE